MSDAILILHATAGAGHTRAAEAIAAAFPEPHAHPVQTVDCLDWTNPVFKRMYAKTYVDLVQKMPELWGYLYDRFDEVNPTGKRALARLHFDQLNARTFRKQILELNPAVVVCTHFLPLELLSAMRRDQQLQAHVVATITDVSPHAFWIYPGIDHYFVANEDSAFELAHKGVAPEQISVSGIPVAPLFATQQPAATARAALELPEAPTVLMLSGGFGVGPVVEMLQSFRDCPDHWSLVVVAGRNEELKSRCEQVAQELGLPVRVTGFVSNMQDYLDAADLVITKPGGLTTSEALVKGKPMLLVAPIPGQEQRNCEYLLEQGAARRLFDPGHACYRVRQMLDNPALLASMQAAARRIARPHAARDIADHVLAQLLPTDARMSSPEATPARNPEPMGA